LKSSIFCKLRKKPPQPSSGSGGDIKNAYLMPKTTASPIKYCGSSYQFKSALLASFYTLILAALFGCANVNAQYNPAKPHHTPEGFKNNYTGNVSKPGSDFLRWQYERAQAGLPKPPQTPTATVPPDLAFVQANAKPSAMQPAITWVGHATMLVQAGGLNVLTDPVFSERASPVQFVGPKRAQPPGLSIAQLPPIDVVLISHNHYDHLDKDWLFSISGGTQLPTLLLGY
jgi:N-acyl-phosphatidylethanolamine-hydrolysing phospholipase D